MIMKVTSDFEIKHFIEYVENQLRIYMGVYMNIVDTSKDRLIVDINGTKFEVNKEALPLITTKCPDLVIKNKILH
jgi:hypothetical protein